MSEKRPTWRARLHEIIFEADTPAGKAFDILLIISILASVVVVMVESVASIRQHHGVLLKRLEWCFTILFSIEYLLRLILVRSTARYATSFFGVIDLLAVLPTYLSLLIPGAQALLVIRLLRVLRVFRILKLAQFVGESRVLMRALKASSRKILVFILAVSTLVVIIGALMYTIEGEAHGYSSIPKGVYWAVVTLTTVGYGDISPGTDVGKFLASLVMLMGYGILAVPTGIVTVELGAAYRRRDISTQACTNCSAEAHDSEAVYCYKCGYEMHPKNSD